MASVMGLSRLLLACVFPPLATFLLMLAVQSKVSRGAVFLTFRRTYIYVYPTFEYTFVI